MEIDTVGFTGTRRGMTPQQKVAVEQILRKVKPSWTVHGDCVGADTDYHNIAETLRKAFNYDYFRIRIRPCDHESRAWSQNYDEMCAVKKPLLRNKDIVLDAGLLIAAPLQGTEIRRSGTWHTVRFAKSVSLPIAIVWPNGLIRVLNF